MRVSLGSLVLAVTFTLLAVATGASARPGPNGPCAHDVGDGGAWLVCEANGGNVIIVTGDDQRPPCNSTDNNVILVVVANDAEIDCSGSANAARQSDPSPIVRGGGCAEIWNDGGFTIVCGEDDVGLSASVSVGPREVR